MSPLDAGYYERVNESSQLEQGNNTSIGDTIQNLWLTRASPKQHYTNYIFRYYHIYSSEVNNTILHNTWFEKGY